MNEKSYFRLTALFLFIATIISEETDTYRVYLLEETVINIRWRQLKVRSDFYRPLSPPLV